ncbi:MAG: integral rane sensor hybrid histidine kinase [Polaromonas sp.]|nr:integral rane sensor hybrid histidine kinase [Polaromonas sp.]
MLKIRTHLVLMTAAILVPVVVFSAVALQMLRDGEREAALRGLHETARATALTVDRKLASSVASLELLGRSPYLESGDLRGFYQQAALLNKHPGSWTVLHDENGQQLINTARPFGEKLPRSKDRLKNLAQKIITAEKPLMSDLIVGQVTKKLVTVLFVPIPVHAGKRYLLTQAFTVDFFNEAVVQPNTPDNWLIAIIGSDDRFIARNLRVERVGQLANLALVAAARAQDHGLIRHHTIEGIDAYDAFEHSDIAGWTIRVAAPVDSIEATAGQAVALATLGLLLALIFATLAAALLGRRLVQTIGRATNAAVALGQRAIPEATSSMILELDQLHTALAQASATLMRSEASRAQAESERERLLQDAREARLRAEDESRAKDQFLAMLGHELRNPLAAISGAIAWSERNGHATAAAAEARAVIQRQSGHLSHLVDDLLDVSRMLGGKITLKKQPLDLAKKVRACLESLRMTGRTAGYELKVMTEPTWVNGDPMRLEQTANNVLVNAFKFTPPGGWVEVTVSSSAGEALLTVKDSGVGISTELLPHVFEVFVQGAASLDRAQGGLGIGLALVRQLVSLHGGTVSAESAGPGQGSTFVVRLPRIAAPAAQPVAALPASTPGRRWRILLIEDNEDARHMMRRLLDMEGHEVMEASSATAGLRLAGLQQPDLAIVDIGLPEMTGYEVAEHLRSDPATHTMGLIALTGYGQEEDRKNAVSAGFDAHLVKSVDINHLLAVIDRCGQAALLRKQAPHPASIQAASPA